LYKRGTSEVDTVTRDRFLEAIHKRFTKTPYGGSQSKQLFFMERKTSGGAWEAYSEMEEFGHQNWGSTVLHPDGSGGIQIVASVGDRKETKVSHLIKEGNVSVWELPPGEYTLAAFSDGIKDQDYYHKYQSAIHMTQAAKTIANAVAKRIMGKRFLSSSRLTGQEIADTIRDYAMIRGRCVRRPNWDDISVAVARVVVKEA
jgi:hypothetical protein